MFGRLGFTCGSLQPLRSLQTLQSCGPLQSWRPCGSSASQCALAQQSIVNVMASRVQLPNPGNCNFEACRGLGRQRRCQA